MNVEAKCLCNIVCMSFWREEITVEGDTDVSCYVKLILKNEDIVIVTFSEKKNTKNK